MAFFTFNSLARFGREMPQLSNYASKLTDGIDLNLARVTNMTDAQVQSEFGTTLTKAQMQSTLTDAKAILADPSIVAIATQVG